MGVTATISRITSTPTGLKIEEEITLPIATTVGSTNIGLGSALFDNQGHQLVPLTIGQLGSSVQGQERVVKTTVLYAAPPATSKTVLFFTYTPSLNHLGKPITMELSNGKIPVVANLGEFGKLQILKTSVQEGAVRVQYRYEGNYPYPFPWFELDHAPEQPSILKDHRTGVYSAVWQRIPAGLVPIIHYVRITHGVTPFDWAMTFPVPH